MNKILYCGQGGLPPYACSGAEITMDEWLYVLASQGKYKCCAYCSKENYNFLSNNIDSLYDNDISIYDKNYSKIFTSNNDKWKKYLEEIIILSNATMIFTQLLGTTDVLNVIDINGLNRSSIYIFIHSLDDLNNILSNKNFYRNVNFICVSKFLFNILKKEFCNVRIIYPVFPKLKYWATKNLSQQRKILFVNPLERKGLDIVCKLAKKYNKEKFLIVQNWHPISFFNRRKIELIENIKLVPHTNDLRKYYQQTKILLVPSQVPEGFGRIVIEANCHGIPAIISKIGGLPETCKREANIGIDKYYEYSFWESSLGKLLYDKKMYNDLSYKAKENALFYIDCDDILKVFKE